MAVWFTRRAAAGPKIETRRPGWSVIRGGFRSTATLRNSQQVRWRSDNYQ